MPGAEAMTALTPEAEARLGEYLGQVRAALAGVAGVSPDEVEADVREHVAAEFASAAGLVGRPELEEVLTRLGPPGQWAAGSDRKPLTERLAEKAHQARGWAERVACALGRAVAAARAAVARGPEDWRLAYLTFGTFAAGVVLIPLIVPFLVVSYLLGRATAATVARAGGELGPRRWLVYPPLVVVALPLLVGLMFWPVVVAVPVAELVEHADRFDRLVLVTAEGEVVPRHPAVRMSDWELQRFGVRKVGVRYEMSPDDLYVYRLVGAAGRAVPGPTFVRVPALAGFAALGALAAWWVAVGGVWWAYPGLPRAVFFPLTAGFAARHARRLVAVGAAALAVWCVFAYRVWENLSPLL